MDSHAMMPDHLVELIFIRLDSAISLLRAASTCKQWLRVVAGADFLRQFRSLHGQSPTAGIYYDRPRVPRQRPDIVVSPSVDIDARFFSLDFLPDSTITPWVWRILDSRGSLLLFARRRRDGASNSFGHIAICEPLTRRYVWVDLCSRFPGFTISKASLIDGESGGGIGMTSFRVVFKLHDRGIYSHTGVFTMGSNLRQSWRMISTNDLMNNAAPSDELATPTCLCWYNQGRRVVALDRSTGRFSSLLLPEVAVWDFHKRDFDMVVTAGHDGAARIVLIGAQGDLRVFARLQSSGKWALAKSVRLSALTRGLPGYDPSFFSESMWIHRTDADSPVILLSPLRALWWFHQDIETMEVAPAPDPDFATAFPCELPWPPNLPATSCLHV